MTRELSVRSRPHGGATPLGDSPGQGAPPSNRCALLLAPTCALLLAPRHGIFEAVGISDGSDRSGLSAKRAPPNVGDGRKPGSTVTSRRLSQTAELQSGRGRI